MPIKADYHLHSSFSGDSDASMEEMIRRGISLGLTTMCFTEHQDYDFPDSWHGKVHYVKCTTAPKCHREKRPLQCRFFPLTPHLSEDGTLHLILSPVELPYTCPLIEEKTELEPRFIKAVYTVWKHLLRDPLIYDLVEYDSSDRDESQLNIVI